MVEVDTKYSLFSTDDGEYFTGCGQYIVEDFADFISGELKEAMIVLLNENPYKVFSLVMDCTKAEMEIQSSKPKANQDE